MHVPTHILSGWVVANVFPLRPRERLFAMIAAAVPDLDGIGVVLGQATYQRWHHVACHNLLFCVITTFSMAGLGPISIGRRCMLAGLYAGLFHLHLMMDYFGSGPGWPIEYLWPFSSFRFVNWSAWPLSSWQNTVAAAVLLLVTIVIGKIARRTPLEVVLPSLDRKLVGHEKW